MRPLAYSIIIITIIKILLRCFKDKYMAKYYLLKINNHNKFSIRGKLVTTRNFYKIWSSQGKPTKHG